MPNYMEEAFSAHESLYRSQVEAAIWGHLAPEPGRRYYGYFLFTYTAWGDYVPIQEDFTDLPSSPWFAEDMNSFVELMATERGVVYRFDGSYIKFKNGRCRWTGRVRKINLD